MNVPNKLSLFRIALVPVVAVVYLFCDFGNTVWSVSKVSLEVPIKDLVVLALFAIASFTDFLDGSIARKRNLITSFGKFIDPIADKLLVNTMFVLLAVDGTIPVIATLLMIWRDTMVDGMRMNASAAGKVVAAGLLGKLKTVLQMFAIIFLLLHNAPFVFLSIPIDEILLWAAVVVSLISGVQYFMKLKDILLESM